jgi:hypothetical protein
MQSTCFSTAFWENVLKCATKLKGKNFTMVAFYYGKCYSQAWSMENKKRSKQELCVVLTHSFNFFRK